MMVASPRPALPADPDAIWKAQLRTRRAASRRCCASSMPAIHAIGRERSTIAGSTHTLAPRRARRRRRRWRRRQSGVCRSMITSASASIVRSVRAWRGRQLLLAHRRRVHRRQHFRSSPFSMARASFEEGGFSLDAVVQRAPRFGARPRSATGRRRARFQLREIRGGRRGRGVPRDARGAWRARARWRARRRERRHGGFRPREV